MAMSIRSPKVEGLARDLARKRGRTMTEVIEGALEAETAREQGLGAALRAQLESISAACSAVPDLDGRPMDEILGYGAEGGFTSGGR